MIIKKINIVDQLIGHSPKWVFFVQFSKKRNFKNLIALEKQDRESVVNFPPNYPPSVRFTGEYSRAVQVHLNRLRVEYAPNPIVLSSRFRLRVW